MIDGYQISESANRQEDTLWSRMLALVIGQDAWEDLLVSLPDAFFGLSVANKALAWRAALRAANRGETEIPNLISAVHDYMVSQKEVRG